MVVAVGGGRVEAGVDEVEEGGGTEAVAAAGAGAEGLKVREESLMDMVVSK